jgi:uncharacterized protein
MFLPKWRALAEFYNMPDIPLSVAGATYTQDFDTLVNTGTSSLLPNGWVISEAGTSANATYTAGTGSSTTGDSYSFGAAASTDRALGSLQSGSNVATIGASFVNNTGASLASLVIAYTGEQWRLGTTGRAVPDRLDFQISFNATSLTTGTWTDVNTLDFTQPLITGTVGALDGNAAANRTAINATISGLNIADGTTFWIRWVNVDATGSDDGLAIDNFSLQGVAAVAMPGTLALAGDVTLSEGNSGTTAFTFTVNRTGGTSGAVSASYAITGSGVSAADASDFGGALPSGTVNFADGQSSATITVNVSGDIVLESDETFTVTLSAPTNGATFGTATAIGTIQNDDVPPIPGTLALAGDVSVAEGNSGTTALIFTVNRTLGSSGAVTAAYVITGSGVDAANAADFGGTLPSGLVSFADGQTSATITVNVSGDVTFEANETFAVTLSSPTGGALLGTATATGTINNDDLPPAGNLSIDDVNTTEGDSGNTIFTFTVTRAGGSTGAVTVDYVVTGGTANAADFGGAFPSGAINFADGETSQTIEISVSGDTSFEPDETFAVTLSNATGGATITDATGAGVIANDDAPPPPPVIFINEVHYDNSGADLNEAIEIAGTAGTNLTGYRIVFYNGGSTPAQAAAATVYGTLNLTGVIDDEGNGYGAVSFNFPGIQNGAPDGFALIAPDNRVVQFLSYEGVITAAAGTPAAGVTSTNIGVSEDGTGAATTSLQATGAGGVAADFTFQPSAPNSFGVLNPGQTFIGPNDPGQVRINDASVVEGNSGVSSLVFTFLRAGGGATNASVDYTITLDGTANAADLPLGAILTGTITFGIGENSQQLIVPINGDTVAEGNETLNIALSNPVGNIVIVDGNAVGTITNDDVIALAIYQIQGADHQTAFAGQVVTTSGIVTGVLATGFYMQDSIGDDNVATSDGIFVSTVTAPTVAVGDSVFVSGTVVEFLPGANVLNLTTTQINSSSVTIASSGNPLPVAVLIGTGGRTVPTTTFDNDGFTIFDPQNDAADFYESLEGMRVTIDAPLVTSATNSFGETLIVSSGGANATGVNARGGITISGAADNFDDYNPERIQIDNDTILFAGFNPAAGAFTQGDILSNVTGIVNYNFQNYEVLVTNAVTITTDAAAVAEETTLLTGAADRITIATYNLENADPTDPRTKFDLLAGDIVFNLGAPDILAVEEIQDADGAGTGSNLSGTVTAQILINAIIAAGGPTYSYIEIAPTTANTTGGEPNGNIRNGFFYNSARVSYIADSATLVPGTAFNGSRSPLSAQFGFNGDVVTAIVMHSTSRGGSDPLFGANQPPANAGDGARTAQATAVRGYVDGLLAANATANIVVLGDFNGYSFESAIEALTAANALIDANTLVSSQERYSYVFDGNSQALDHILITPGLYATAQYDAVHLNAEQLSTTRPTDHDPQIISVALGSAIINGGPEDNVFIGSISNETFNGLAGTDTIDYSAASASIAVDLSGVTPTGRGTQIGVDRLNSVETVILGAGNDVGIGGAGNETFNGGNGADILAGNAGSDILNGEAGIDTASYVANTGAVYVELGAEFTLETGVTTGTVAAADIIVSQDVLLSIENANGSAFGDRIYGTDGDNVFAPGAGSDIVYAEGGVDTLDYSAAAGAVFADISAFTVFESTAVTGIVSAGSTFLSTDYVFAFENLTGSAFGDRLYGNAEANTINGGAGDDIIYGGAGADVLIGGLGNDALIGEAGADIMTGGGGADRFFFSTPLDGVVDIITDFGNGVDQLFIQRTAFGLAPGSSVNLVVNGPATVLLAPTFLYNSASGVLSFDADGSGAGAAVDFANIGPNIGLSVGDIVLYG